MRFFTSFVMFTCLGSALTVQAQAPDAPAAPAPAPAPGQPAEAFEPRTLIGPNTGPHGFFIAPAVQLGPAVDNQRLWVGGRIAYQMDHRIAIGFGGYGLVDEPRVSNLPDTDPQARYLSGGYGGLLLEYTVAPASLLHFSVPVLIGAGGAAYTYGHFDDHGGRNRLDNDNGNLDSKYNPDAFFVTEAGANVEINITRYMRFSVGGAYRYVDGLKLERTTSADLSGFTVNAGLKVGIL